MKSKTLSKYIIIYLTILATLIFILSGCAKQKTNMAFSNKAEEYIEALNNITTCGKINGQILVAKDGEILLNKGFGYADYDKKTPITEDTVFLIGSNTKPITAIAIMQLHQKGLLNIKDPICKYIPNVEKEITIEHLLTHTSGVPRDAKVNFYSYISKDDLINKILSQQLEFKPGTKYQYSNAAYSLLACLIEIASGQGYEEYLQQNIFKPLGMKSTGVVTSKVKLPKMATGYSIINSDLREVTPNEELDLSVFLGSGNIYSTAKDLYKLDRALYIERILNKDVIQSMYTNAYGKSSPKLCVISSVIKTPWFGLVD